MNRIRHTLAAAAASLALAMPALAQSPIKAPTKALRTTATAAASRAADKVATHVATTEAAAGQQAAPPKATPKPAAKAATPAPAAKPEAARAAASSRPAAPAKSAGRAAATTAAAAAAVDSARPTGGTSVARRGAANEMVFNREVYAYPGAGRRDPFASLLKSGDLRPLISDLRLVTVIYDATGRNSVAIMRDLTTKDQYRVKTGQQLGRMRVVQIRPREVVFSIDEFGFNRQETLSLADDTTSARNR